MTEGCDQKAICGGKQTAIRQIFQGLLDLEDPWQVVAMELRDEDRSAEIDVK